jgi:D-beta-D-heptose 7-phosphate kinase/D-beta-D-heptose 1-phosphate adenosyltransferase
VVLYESEHAVLGGAANTAANVAALGAQATLVGLLGDDPAGREMAHLCGAGGIRLIPLRDRRPTTRKVRVLGRQQQLLRVDYEHIAPLDPALETRLLAALAHEVRHADVIVVSDYAKGLLAGTVCQRLIEMAHGAGKPVVVDPRPQHASRYARCDYLTPNWTESQALAGVFEGAPSADAVQRTGVQLRRKLQCNVLVTLGAGGIAFVGKDPRERFTVSAAAREVFDVSGAGDTVVATFALAIAAGCSHLDAVTLANRAAGIVVSKRGTAIVTPDELLARGDAELRLLHRSDLRRVCAELRANRKRIVAASGSFDPLHPDHLELLHDARQQGDVLIVGLREDEGTGRGPASSQATRARMLLALRSVDYVHIFSEPAPVPFLEAVRPDVHVSGPQDAPRPDPPALEVRGTPVDRLRVEAV